MSRLSLALVLALTALYDLTEQLINDIIYVSHTRNTNSYQNLLYYVCIFLRSYNK